MKSRHIRMTIETFHRMEWELGWKYEYWNGCAHISPREAAMSCVLEVGPRTWPGGPTEPEAVPPNDRDALIRAYLAAFEDSVDYCDWPAAKIREHAEANIDGFFAGRRGPALRASRLIRGRGDDDGCLLGALLVVETGPRRALLDLLFVVQGRQRQGLASALAGSALAELDRMGFQTLESRYLLANQASRAWHHRFGFVDQPDAMSARALLVDARHRLERQRVQGAVDRVGLSRLESEVARWETEVERLDAEQARLWEDRRSGWANGGSCQPS